MHSSHPSNPALKQGFCFMAFPTDLPQHNTTQHSTAQHSTLLPAAGPRPNVYAHKSAPGLILATGNVGKHLDFSAATTCTFMSRDGGLTWEDIADNPGGCICGRAMMVVLPAAWWWRRVVLCICVYCVGWGWGGRGHDVGGHCRQPGWVHLCVGRQPGGCICGGRQSCDGSGAAAWWEDIADKHYGWV